MSTKNNSTAEKLCVQCCPVRSGVRRAPRPMRDISYMRGDAEAGQEGDRPTDGSAKNAEDISHVRYRTTVPAVPGDRTQRRDFRSPVNVAPRSRLSPPKSGQKISQLRIREREADQ